MPRFDSFAGHNALLRIRTIAILILSYPGVWSLIHIFDMFVAQKKNLPIRPGFFVTNQHSSEKSRTWITQAKTCDIIECYQNDEATRRKKMHGTMLQLH